MPGETDVINVGLRKIGATPIILLTDGSASANAADDIYTEVRDDLLRSHPWNFATKRVKLAQLTTAPVFEFDHAYALPSDWLRTISVHDNDAGHGTMLYRMEHVGSQRTIVTSSDDVYLRYVYQVTDPNLMVADFRHALEDAIASALAVPLASSNSMEEKYAIRSSRKLNQAKSVDAMGGFPELRPRGSWASSRYGRRHDSFTSND